MILRRLWVGCLVGLVACGDGGTPGESGIDPIDVSARAHAAVYLQAAARFTPSGR